MKDKLNTTCYVFSMLETNLSLSSALLFMIFYLCTCYVATWLLSYIARIISCMLMFRVLWSRPQCFYIWWYSLCWQQSPPKLCCYHLPTRGPAWVKLGDADTLQMYLQFMTLLACFTPFVTCYLYTLLCFIAFSVTNLLTRCRSASSLFRKYSRNWTKQKPNFLFFQRVHVVRRRVEEGQQGGHTTPRHGSTPGRA